MAETRRRIMIVGVLLALIAGCGDGSDEDLTTRRDPGPAPTAGIRDGGPAQEHPEGWGSMEVTVRTLHVADDDRTLTAEVALRPVRMTDGSCVGEVSGSVTDENNPDVVWARIGGAGPNVTADPSLLEPEKAQGACPEEVSTIEMTVPAALGERDIMVQPEGRWVPTNGGDFGPCRLPSCDPDTGDPPATASCDDGAALVEDIRTAGDVDRHASIGESRCQDGWAMVEVDSGAGACGPADGKRPSCTASQRIDRLFLRAGTPHWEVLTRTREAGCGNVADVAADYPVALCEDRPAVGST